MRYFAPPNAAVVRAAMSAGLIGAILTPRGRNRLPDGAAWCADNGCFGKDYPGDDAWWRWLNRQPHRDRCAFAVAPDVVGDATATLARSLPWLPRIRALGIPAAFVAQDGLEDLQVPWDDFDVLFIGGTDAFKLGSAMAGLAAQARTRGKSLHMGRVNSQRRYDYARHLGCDSVDGTYLAFGPDVNLPDVLSWVRSADQLTLEL